jgi:hypothetical protein
MRKGGVNLATIPEFASAVGESDLDTTMRTALAIGGFVAFGASERFDVQPEVFYVQKGIRFEGSAGPFPGGDATIRCGGRPLRRRPIVVRCRRG